MLPILAFTVENVKLEALATLRAIALLKCRVKDVTLVGFVYLILVEMLVYVRRETTDHCAFVEAIKAEHVKRTSMNVISFLAAQERHV